MGIKRGIWPECEKEEKSEEIINESPRYWGPNLGCVSS